MTDRAVAGASPVRIRLPRFVGREREMAALDRALAAAPAVILVEGEAGIGKSRLITEYLAAGPGERLRVLRAACLPFRTPHTLGPLVDALRDLTEGVAGLRLSPLAGSLLPLLNSRPERITLEPLGIGGTAEVVASMLDDAVVSAEFAGFVHRATEGVPLAVQELVRLMDQRADLPGAAPATPWMARVSGSAPAHWRGLWGRG